ncbi:hypothetical protein NDR89_15585 [Cupriavidus gilardii]|uniref:Uncharacterized protein n=1 Tax=Cupriavidus gilardii TaxID=82541 RepID=A0ABY4VZ16_9BURK|nr:hypothetical protein [Cupriavidus gilardii]USE81141.1 hypothetical protein NDR89_15585 [Cupriavidus gilardii]
MKKVTVTQNMVAAALDVGSKRGVLVDRPQVEAVREMLGAALALLDRREVRSRYDFDVIGLAGQRVRARFIRVGHHRGYLQVETESGSILNVHANEILPARVR